ncbi:MAG: hypothetical protein R3B54_02390 [Bdellovibrionota bacterium]
MNTMRLAGLLILWILVFPVLGGAEENTAPPQSQSEAPAAESTDVPPARTAANSPWTLTGAIFKDQQTPPFSLGAWLQVGYTTRSDGVFDTHPGYIDLQQAWVFLERKADGRNGVDFGGRVDFVYGTDAQNI